MRLLLTLLAAASIAAATVAANPEPLVQSDAPFNADPRWCLPDLADIGASCAHQPVPA